MWKLGNKKISIIVVVCVLSGLIMYVARENDTFSLGANEQVGVLVIDQVDTSRYIDIHSEKDKMIGKTIYCIVSENTHIALKRSIADDCQMFIVPRGKIIDDAILEFLSAKGERRSYVKSEIR